MFCVTAQYWSHVNVICHVIMRVKKTEIYFCLIHFCYVTQFDVLMARHPILDLLHQNQSWVRNIRHVTYIVFDTSLTMYFTS